METLRNGSRIVEGDCFTVETLLFTDAVQKTVELHFGNISDESNTAPL